MKKISQICFILFELLISSCANTIDGCEENSNNEPFYRENLMEMLSDLSFSYNKPILVTDIPSTSLLDVYSMVENVMMKASNTAKNDCFVVVEGNDAFYMDPIESSNILSGNIENIEPGSHTYYNNTYLFLPCNLTVSWGADGVFASSDNGQDCVIRSMSVIAYPTYAKIDGRISILGTYGGTFNVSGYTNDSHSWTIFDCFNCPFY